MSDEIITNPTPIANPTNDGVSLKTEQPTPKTKVTPNLGSKQFRPWLVKLLKKGGMDASLLIEMAKKEFGKQMNEADLAPVVLKGVQKFTHTWMRRLYDSRKAMVEAGLMFASKHFPNRGNWWQLTPKGLLPEHKDGY